MEDFLIIVILAVVLGAAIAYIVKAKKSGVKCIGCSAGGACHCRRGSEEELEFGCGCACEGRAEDGKEETCGCCRSNEK